MTFIFYKIIRGKKFSKEGLAFSKIFILIKDVKNKVNETNEKYAADSTAHFNSDKFDYTPKGLHRDHSQA